jgi:hypothetical protein
MDGVPLTQSDVRESYERYAPRMPRNAAAAEH